VHGVRPVISLNTLAFVTVSRASGNGLDGHRAAGAAGAGDAANARAALCLEPRPLGNELHEAILTRASPLYRLAVLNALGDIRGNNF
jgi:hypothetical protein